MDRIRLEAQDDPVRRFILSLRSTFSGALLELNGQAVACVVPVGAQNGGMEADWTDAKNDRRCELIDRKYSGTLTAEEAVELFRLQEEMHQFLDRVAPLPLEDARRLHQELLHKAKHSAKS